MTSTVDVLERADGELVKPTPASRPLSLAQLLVGAVVFAGVAVARGVDNTWDLRHYHFAVGWSALRGELPTPDWVVAGAMSFFNPTIDVIYVLFADLNPWLAFAVLAAPAFLSCVVLVYFIAAIVPTDGGFASWVRLTLAMLAVLGSDALGQIGGTMADLTLTLPVTLGAYLVYTGLAQSSTRVRLRTALGSACLGLAMGLKVTVIPISVGFASAAVIAVVLSKRGPVEHRSAVRMLDVVAGFVGGWLVTGGAWAIYLWWTFGNPIFPFLNDLFGSRWASTESWATPYHLSPLDWVLFPLRVAVIQGRHNVSPYEFIEPRFALGLIGVALAVWAATRSWRRGDRSLMAGLSAPTVFLCGGWFVSYLVWAITLANGRYAIPLLALSIPTLLSGASAMDLNWRTSIGWYKVAGPALVAILAIATAVVVVGGSPEWGPRATDPQSAWTFPEGPQSDQRNALITSWRGQDVVIVSGRWPLGFMVAELSPRRVWNLRERPLTDKSETTRFAVHAGEQLDRSGSLVVYDPRFDDQTTILRRLTSWLGAQPSITECGVFVNGWTPAAVCRFVVDAVAAGPFVVDAVAAGPFVVRTVPPR